MKPPGRRQLPVVAWLAIVWVALWGDVSFGTVLAGTALAVVVLTLLPMPPLPPVRLRARGLALLAMDVAVDLTRSSVQVAWLALRPGGPAPRAAVIRSQLESDSDIVQAVTAELLSLVPGTVVIELDDVQRVLFVHVLGVRGPQDLQRAHRRVAKLERRVVAALGDVRRGSALRLPEVMR